MTLDIASYCMIFVTVICLLSYFFNFVCKNLIHLKYYTVRKPPMVFYYQYCNNWLYRVPPDMSYMQSSWLAWHDTEGSACKEVKSQICYFIFSLKRLIKFLPSYFVDTFFSKQTIFSSWSKKSSRRSLLVHNVLKQVEASFCLRKFLYLKQKFYLQCFHFDNNKFDICLFVVAKHLRICRAPY